VGDIPLDMINQ